MKYKLKMSKKVHFYLRLTLLIAITLFLIYDFFLALFYPQDQFADLSYSERIANYYAFFTTQSNYIVAFYFFVFMFKTEVIKEKPRFIFRLAVTSYITITMLVFWIGIFTNTANSDHYDTAHWVSTVVLHLVIPTAMIINYTLTCGEEYYEYNRHHRGYLWIILSYIFVYLIIVMVRGTLRHFDNKPLPSQFPYFFLNYFEPGGEFLAPMAMVMICVLSIVIQYFYIWLNNAVFKKMHPETVLPKYDIRLLKVNPSCVVGLIIGLIFSGTNFLICTLYVVINIVGIEWLGFLSKIFVTRISLFIVWSFFFMAFCLVFFYSIAIYFAWKGNPAGRITAGVIVVTTLFISWIWVIGPIIGVIAAFFIFNSKELVKTSAEIKLEKEKERLKQELKELPLRKRIKERIRLRKELTYDEIEVDNSLEV